MSHWRRPVQRFAFVVALGALASGGAMTAQSTVNKQLRSQTAAVDDADFARSVKEWTTRPEFSSPLVDHLPKVAGIPTPKDVLGYYVGAPKKLTRVDGLLRYYRALAAASPRVKILPAGTT